MFTGLVQAVGDVTALAETGDGLRLRIRSGGGLGPLRLGDSVAVSGVCMTIVEQAGGEFDVEAVQATLDRTTVGTWQVGGKVNLERALLAGEPLGGHIVQGHVDGVGRVVALDRNEASGWLAVELTDAVDEASVTQGSMTIDGVSLTINALSEGVARFAIIPYTWTHTTLGRLAVGAQVNLEADVIGKYVGRAIRPYIEHGRD